MNPSVTDGPALLAAAAAVRTKRPAPMMAPMPSMTRSAGPSVRLRPCAASASARSWSTDLVAKSGLSGIGDPFLGRSRSRRSEHGRGSVDDDADDEPVDGGDGQRLPDK